MARHLRDHRVPPARVLSDGVVDEPRGPVGFSAAVLPYLAALGETRLEDEQMSRMRSELDASTGLYGRPAKYYDQNLALFALGWTDRRFSFDARGRLRTTWRR